jgi:hypothetical protein
MPSPSLAHFGRALLLLGPLCVCVFLGACKTTRPKDDVVVVVDDQPLPDGVRPPLAEGPAPAPAALTEALPPVRGGERVLPPYRGADPCRMALRGESPVARACSERGLRGATELMQTFVRRAKAEGIVFVCNDCHADEDDLTNLRPQADGEFRKLLFLARPDD